ncbi:MAG: NADH-quinone oxidoreductase subunit N [Myxococcota bacterium]
MIQDLAYASPLLIVTAVGLLALMAGVFSRGQGESSGWLASVVGMGFALALGAIWFLWDQAPLQFQTPSMAHSLIFDEFGLAMCAVILVGALLTTVSAANYLPAQGSDHHEYYALVAFSTMGMMGLVVAGDLLTLFVALEVMSIAVYVLAGFKRESAFSTESAMKYFILGSFASALLLLGIAFVYGVTGEVSLVGIGSAFHFQEGLAADPIAGIGMLLILASFAFKIAAAPFHMWIPDVYEGALSSVTGFMAVCVKTAAFGALARVVLTCFGDDAFRTAPLSWELLIMGLAVLSMFAGNLMALAQTNLKRMLAYSAIAHTGYILLAFLVDTTVSAGEGTITVNALGGGLIVYLLGYTLANAAAFSVAAAVGNRNVEDISEPAYAGLAKREPFLAFGLAIAVLSLLGIPATAGFMGKLTVFSEVLTEEGNLWLVVVAVVNSVISAWYYLRVILVAYMKDEATDVEPIATRTMRWSVGVATALTLIVGLLPGKVIDASVDAGASLARTTTPGLSVGQNEQPGEAAPEARAEDDAAVR